MTKKLLCVRNLRSLDGEGIGLVAEKTEEYGNKWHISRIGTPGDLRFGKEARLIDGEGDILVPAFWDLYGFPDCQRTAGALKEETGAAARSGFGWVSECDPPGSDRARSAFHQRISGAHCNLTPIEPLPDTPEEIAGAAERGAAALSDGGRSIGDSARLFALMQEAAKHGLLMMLSPRSPEWQGVLHQGRVANYFRVAGVPDAAEEAAVARLIVLARASRCHVHLPCISGAGALRQIKAAKAEGLPITCGVTPFHFACCEEDLFLVGTAGKILPPLSDRENVDALIRGIADGVVDCISTAHTPCRLWEKQRPMESAAFGASGYATALSAGITYLVDRGVVSLKQLVAMMTTAPAAILGRDTSLSVGAPADFALIKPMKTWVVGETGGAHAPVTPFAGQTLRGVVSHSFISGVWY